MLNDAVYALCLAEITKQSQPLVTSLGARTQMMLRVAVRPLCFLKIANFQSLTLVTSLLVVLPITRKSYILEKSLGTNTKRFWAAQCIRCASQKIASLRSLTLVPFLGEAQNLNEVERSNVPVVISPNRESLI